METMIYIALFGILMSGAVIGAYNLLDGGSKNIISTRIQEEGTFIDGTRVSDVMLADLDLRNHSSVKVRIGIKQNAANVGGVNIFGKGFGNYDQDIVMRMHLQ